ncbi:MAG: histidine phosphatase family protein [Anaerolineae bacterium]|nr:histidine phosphatase family protein [Anaerolineae bacterium]
MRLFLARHGQSESNVDPNYVGHDAPLTATGEQQAHLLGKWLEKRQDEFGIDYVYYSPLRRAFRTAEIANEYLKLPLEVLPELEEMREAVLPSLPRRRHPFQPDSHYIPPDATTYYEGYREQVRRALEVIFSALDRPKPILAVCHGGTMSTIIRIITERHDLRVDTNNTGLFDLQWTDGKWQFNGLNITRHLPDELLTW